MGRPASSSSRRRPGGYQLVVPVVSRAVTQPLWRALRAAAEAQSVRQLHVLTGAHPNAIQLRLKRWERAGLVSVTSQRPRKYLMSATDSQPPRMAADGALTRRPSGRQRMWTSMRVLKRFDLPTLMMTAEVSRRSAETYINNLSRAGYLRTLARGNSACGTWSNYQLVRRSGPRAPAVNHSRAGTPHRVLLVDRNDGTEHDISPGKVSLRAPAVPRLRRGED